MISSNKEPPAMLISRQLESIWNGTAWILLCICFLALMPVYVCQTQIKDGSDLSCIGYHSTDTGQTDTGNDSALTNGSDHRVSAHPGNEEDPKAAKHIVICSHTAEVTTLRTPSSKSVVMKTASRRKIGTATMTTTTPGTIPRTTISTDADLMNGREVRRMEKNEHQVQDDNVNNQDQVEEGGKLKKREEEEEHDEDEDEDETHRMIIGLAIPLGLCLTLVLVAVLVYVLWPRPCCQRCRDGGANLLHRVFPTPEVFRQADQGGNTPEFVALRTF